MLETSKTISSLRWLTIGRFCSQLISWVVTIVVIRLLNPQDYGLMAIAMMVINFGELFREMGLDTALIQKRELDEIAERKAFGIVIIFNIFLYVIFFTIAPLLSFYFGYPELKLIIIVIALRFLIGVFSVVPNALLSRNMAFKKKSIIEFITALSASSATLFLALNGSGVWSLVFGNLIGVVVRVVVTLMATKYWKMPIFSLRDMKQLIFFGGFATFSRISFLTYSQADVFIAGKLLGSDLLGFYSVALQLAKLPMNKVMSSINLVGLAAFSRLRSNKAVLKANFLKAIGVISFFSFPVFFGISSVAPEIVNCFLGEKWLASILPLQILSLIIPLRMLANSDTSVILAIGKPKVSVINGVIACLILIPGFYVGSYWGIKGLAFAWLGLFPFYYVIRLKIVLAVLDIKIVDYLKEIRFSFISASFMYICVCLTRYIFCDQLLENIISFIVLTMVGAFIFLIINYIGRKKYCLKVFSLMLK